jgi:hypothetical protein
VPSAYVLIVCELGYEDQTVNDLNKLTGVDATRLAGDYNCKGKCRKYRKFNKIIGLEIKK